MPVWTCILQHTGSQKQDFPNSVFSFPVGPNRVIRVEGKLIFFFNLLSHLAAWLNISQLKSNSFSSTNLVFFHEMLFIGKNVLPTGVIDRGHRRLLQSESCSIVSPPQHHSAFLCTLWLSENKVTKSYTTEPQAFCY